VIPLALVIALLAAAGTYQLFQRNALRAVVGLALLSHAANLSLIAMRRPIGLGAPLVGQPNPTDPLPQALVLTAIVISFGITAVALALAARVSERSDTTDSQESLL
jgi:multicomponent Na+:H+ antiporter subunit C